MKKVIPLLLLIFLLCCKREIHQENIQNKPPVSNAGADQLISADSTLLNGTGSSDADGNITEWLWKKISGPQSLSIADSNSAKTIIKNLSAGIYRLELTVKDNGGLQAKDTVQITVWDTTTSNRAPVADAGADTVLIYPVTTSHLDGSRSSDADNNISYYLWTEISGPSPATIGTATALKTDISNLAVGVYVFELLVTDAGGLSDRDTINLKIEIYNPPVVSCDNSNRPHINAQLVPIGTLSSSRGGMTVVSNGNTIAFAGGMEGSVPPIYESSTVDFFNITANTWTTAKLSVPRLAIAATASGNKFFFAGGGYIYADYYHDVIDIYDNSTNSWKTSALSKPRTTITAAAVGNKVLFAGGSIDPSNNATTDLIDIYDLSADQWSTGHLSEARAGGTAVTVGSKIYFVGGSNSKSIDVYDNAADSWSVSSSNLLQNITTGTFAADKFFWAYYNECSIEIQNINTGISTRASLSTLPFYHQVFKKDNKIVVIKFNSNTFDIYDIATDSWSIGDLPQKILSSSSVIAVNDIIYIAGGSTECVPTGPSSCTPVYTNRVYKLEF